MFEKKCARCRNKIKKGYEFCPYCGNILNEIYDKEDYGMIGKNDFFSEPVFPRMNESFMDKMFNQTMKMLEKQMKTIAQEMNEPPQNRIPINEPVHSLNVQFFVNGKRVFPPRQEQIREEQPKKVNVSKMPQEKLERFSKLKRIEPVSRVKRLGGKVIYELEVPGVKDLEDVLINRLESSIEIKALAKDQSYSKIINVNLPIIRYGLDNGNLIIEMQGR